MLTSFKPLRKVYLNNQKTVLKLYMRAIGSAAGLSAMLLSLIDFNPNILFRGSTSHQKVPQKPPQKVPPTTIDPSEGRDLEPGFYNTINKYLLQLVVLSKWRMLKENHPWFTLLKVGTWRRMETAVMCYLVWKLMNLNDYIYKNASGLGNKQILHLRHNPWIKAVDRIMN
ncbi:hypothetical protein JCM33374_g4861 [Metschnikowia sp. JCM 33374]|nr:hypothetical protein JCM33374_g4861 [Metschnikowia sp. JCM 33374]